MQLFSDDYRNLLGTPVSEIFTHPREARQMLEKMSLQYPGELFNLEFVDEDNGMVVTWIPAMYASYFLGHAFAKSMNSDWNSEVF